MTQGIELTETERQLANELAFLVSKKMWEDLSHSLYDGKLHDLAQSNYEVGCSSLLSVGVYKGAEHPTLHEVIVPVERVLEHMQSLEEVERESFDELLSGFIENYISYGGGLAGHRRAFQVPIDLEKVADLLVLCGYADREGMEIRWTEKISPIMVRWYIWDADGNCLAERWQLEREEAARKFVDELPTSLQRRLKKTLRTKGELSAVEDLQRHWNGQRWTYFPRFRKTGISSKHLPRGGIATIKAAFALLRNKR